MFFVLVFVCSFYIVRPDCVLLVIPTLYTRPLLNVSPTRKMVLTYIFVIRFLSVRRNRIGLAGKLKVILSGCA